MLHRIEFRRFRCLDDGVFEAARGAHLLLGPNGAGKTSILEAIYALATTRSFRTTYLAECCRTGESSFALRGEIQSSAQAELAFAWREGVRERRVNGNNAVTTDYLRALPVVSWWAGDLKVLQDGPRYRRLLLDQGVVANRPLALEVLSRYRRTLEQKRQLLRSGGRGLAAWNELLAGAAAELIDLRSTYVDELQAALTELKAIYGERFPPLSIDYRPSPSSGETTEEILSRFTEFQQREIDERRPLIGPHRDDLEILFNGLPAQRMASAGEKKICGLLLTAARCRVLESNGRSPVLLLDDFDAELDRDRLQLAWDLFAGYPQRIFTSSHREPFQAFENTTVTRLENGRFVTE